MSKIKAEPTRFLDYALRAPLEMTINGCGRSTRNDKRQDALGTTCYVGAMTRRARDGLLPSNGIAR